MNGWYQRTTLKLTVNINGVLYNEAKLLFSASQGSINYSILFNAYSSTIPECIPVGVEINRSRFGDDYSLQTGLDPIPERLKVIKNRFNFAMDSVQNWMNRSRLTSKRRIHIGSEKQLNIINIKNP